MRDAAAPANEATPAPAAAPAANAPAEVSPATTGLGLDDLIALSAAKLKPAATGGVQCAPAALLLADAPLLCSNSCCQALSRSATGAMAISSLCCAQPSPLRVASARIANQCCGCTAPRRRRVHSKALAASFDNTSAAPPRAGRRARAGSGARRRSYARRRAPTRCACGSSRVQYSAHRLRPYSRLALFCI